jgi:hypothetical protein
MPVCGVWVVEVCVCLRVVGTLEHLTTVRCLLFPSRNEILRTARTLSTRAVDPTPVPVRTSRISRLVVLVLQSLRRVLLRASQFTTSLSPLTTSLV